jgi:hypothetical protein
MLVLKSHNWCNEKVQKRKLRFTRMGRMFAKVVHAHVSIIFRL